MPPDALLTVADVAARISISTPSVLSLIASQKLIAVNVSMGAKRPRWRIAADELDRFLAERQTCAPVTKIRRRRSVSLVEYV